MKFSKKSARVSTSTSRKNGILHSVLTSKKLKTLKNQELFLDPKRWGNVVLTLAPKIEGIDR